MLDVKRVVLAVFPVVYVTVMSALNMNMYTHIYTDHVSGLFAVIHVILSNT